MGHLLEWTKSGILRTPNAGQDVEQRELTYIVCRNKQPLWEKVWYNTQKYYSAIKRNRLLIMQHHG